MYDLNFADDVLATLPAPFRRLYAKYLETGVMPVSIKVIKSIIDSTGTLLNTPLNDDVYNAIFVSTAEGVDLDKLGSQLGITRDGESDTDYRNRLLYYLQLKNSGSTIETISNYIESFGYVIDHTESGYDYAFIQDETGLEDYCYTGYDGGVISPLNWINYTFYFYLDPTPSYYDMVFLEGKLEKVKKVFNKVLIR